MRALELGGLGRTWQNLAETWQNLENLENLENFENLLERTWNWWDLQVWNYSTGNVNMLENFLMQEEISALGRALSEISSNALTLTHERWPVWAVVSACVVLSAEREVLKARCLLLRRPLFLGFNRGMRMVLLQAIVLETVIVAGTATACD